MTFLHPSNTPLTLPSFGTIPPTEKEGREGKGANPQGLVHIPHVRNLYISYSLYFFIALTPMVGLEERRSAIIRNPYHFWQFFFGITRGRKPEERGGTLHFYCGFPLPVPEDELILDTTAEYRVIYVSYACVQNNTPHKWHSLAQFWKTTRRTTSSFRRLPFKRLTKVTNWGARLGLGQTALASSHQRPLRRAHCHAAKIAANFVEHWRP